MIKGRAKVKSSLEIRWFIHGIDNKSLITIADLVSKHQTKDTHQVKYIWKLKS